MVPENVVVPTYRVISRHSSDCPDSDCKKHIAVYDPRITNPIERQSTIPARTRDWQVAERIAVAYRDQHDPDKARAAAAEAKLKSMQEKAESQNVTIEKAVSMFIAAKRKEGISLKRIERYLPLLGDVDPQTLAFKINRRGSRGRLAAWLNTLNPRPVYISDLTPVLVEEFRNTWDFDSDLTDFGTFGDLKRFLRYCVEKSWSSLVIGRSQMAGINAPRVKAGSRTTAFTTDQYDNIITAIKSRFPKRNADDTFKNLEDENQYQDAHRLLAFVELMRWGGLALGDAVFFNLNTMLDNVHVKYRRRKTRNKTVRYAQPKLLPHVVDLLKTTVPIDGDLNRPFYDKNIADDTNTGYWSAAAKEAFRAAGIESVKTDIRDREPHCHMLRDTFAVGQLRTQYELGLVNHKAVADALGDTVAIMLKNYAPWIDEFEKAHQMAQDRIVEAQIAERAKKEADQSKKVTSIADGRK
jgi:integrase